ncbi:MAG: DinB family protein [Chloroflexota bacterium]
MHQLFKDFQERFAKAHQDLLNVLDALPEHAIDWVPGEGMNSTAVLIAHVAGASRYWVGDMALGDDSQRIRQDEFDSVGHSKALLKTKLDDSMAYIQQGLTKISLTDLDRMVERPHTDQVFSVGWCLLHALEHTTEHVGHLQILQQLWDARSS